MTSLTVNYLMPPFEGEIGQGMVEAPLLPESWKRFPAIEAMTEMTIVIPIPAFMFILVTGLASLRGTDEIRALFLGMTFTAFQPPVFPFQGIGRLLIMRELILSEVNQSKIPTPVVWMTGPTPFSTEAVMIG